MHKGTSDSLSAPNDGSLSILSFIEIPAQLLRAALAVACTRAPASPCFCLCMTSLSLWMFSRMGPRLTHSLTLSGSICSSFPQLLYEPVPLERLHGIRGARSLSQQSSDIHSHRPIRVIIKYYTLQKHIQVQNLYLDVFPHHILWLFLPLIRQTLRLRCCQHYHCPDG
jgi:hypothetical protein